jgi:hypothetical protein
LLRGVVAIVVFCGVPIAACDAQLATVGAGVLLSERSPEPVFELHVASPPVFRTRAYGTLSWTNDSAKPTVITAAERSVLQTTRASIGLGAGALWLEGNDYRPYPIAVASGVVPLPIRRTAVVAIASTQPFQEFAWSLVLKASFVLWSRT